MRERLLSEVGQLTTAYSPLLTLLQQPKAYFVFNLRENILAHVKKGDKIEMRVPALNNQRVMAQVRYIAPLGDYATKSATRATGDFDLKTFEVRLYPLEGLPLQEVGVDLIMLVVLGSSYALLGTAIGLFRDTPRLRRVLRRLR